MAKKELSINLLNKHQEALTGGSFGLQLATLRVDRHTYSPSRTLHPRTFGSRAFNPFIQTGYAESQLILQTQLKNNMFDHNNPFDELNRLQIMATQQLNTNELLWPFSMPPQTNADSLRWIDQHFERTWFTDYRTHLKTQFGSLNRLETHASLLYMPSEHLIKATKMKKDELLLHITQYLTRFQWLITYLYGASPINDNPSDRLPAEALAHPVRSWHLSPYSQATYTNEVDYTDWHTYQASMQKIVADHQLQSTDEIGMPIQIKTNNEDQLYLEIRYLDLNPYTDQPAYVSRETIAFIHLLIMNSLVNPIDINTIDITAANQSQARVALQSPEEGLPAVLQREAENLLHQFNQIEKHLFKQSIYRETIEHANQALDHPKETVAHNLLNEIEHNSLTDFAIERAKRIQQHYQDLTIEQAFNGDLDPTLIPIWIEAVEAGLTTNIINSRVLEISLKDKHVKVTSQQPYFDLHKSFPHYQTVDELKGY